MLAERADPNTGFKNLERQVLSGPERMDGQITRYFAAMAIRPKLNPLSNISIGYPQILTVSNALESRKNQFTTALGRREVNSR